MAVGVVVHHGRSASALGQQLCKRNVVEAPKVRTHVERASTVHQAGDPYPNGRPWGGELVSESQEGVDETGATFGGGHAPLSSHLAGEGWVDCHPQHLRAPDVDPDGLHEPSMPRGEKAADPGSVAQKRADLPEDIQIGVADADGDRDALRERLVDRILHDIDNSNHRHAVGGVGGTHR